MNYKLFLFSLSVFFLITSCEEDDHHHDDDCHECHVLCAMDDGTTHEHEIGEFCGDDLWIDQTLAEIGPENFSFILETYKDGR